MTFSAHDALLLLALLAAGAALLAAAPYAKVPYPIFLVLGGLALGFVPGIPHVAMRPDVVLVAILPPLLYSSAFFTSLRDLRRNRRPITLLAVGLVLVTTFAVGAVAHRWLGLPWSVAFVLGAVVAPTDPVAASAIAQRLGIPRRIVAVIEGEALVNDATALVAYRVAVGAVVSGTFSIWHASERFVVSVVGGVAIGLLSGWIIRRVRRRLDHSPTEIAIALFSPYLAYLAADAANVSAVLAAVTVGVYVGWYTPELTTAQTRLQGDAVWTILVFLLNALLFGLVGLQLRPILDALSGRSPGLLLRDAAVVSLTVIATRLLWIYPATYLPRLLSERVRRADPAPPWQWPTLIGWTGMRGAVSLAAALAVPLSTDSGAPFPQRERVVYLAFGVIVATLVLQGLSMPLVIRLLGLESDGLDVKEETKARIHAAEAALARIEELAGEDWVREETAERMRGLYNFRRSRFAARFDDGDDGSIEQRSQDFQRLRHELLEAERAAVVELRRNGRIDDSVMHRIERDLDLEAARLDFTL